MGTLASVIVARDDVDDADAVEDVNGVGGVDAVELVTTVALLGDWVAEVALAGELVNDGGPEAAFLGLVA